MLKWLLNLLRTPSGFIADPWGYLRNQSLHGLVFGVGAVFLGVPWWVAAIGYWVLVEQVQIALFDGATWDSLEDVAFVATAAATAAYAFWPGLLIFALFIASGFARRRTEREFIKGVV
jgi:hypothetical protein